jgi:beta-lactamase class A
MTTVPVALELARQAADGAFDLAGCVTVPPGHPTPSPYGLATTLMIGISDNVATDLIHRRPAGLPGRAGQHRRRPRTVL